MPRTQAFDWFSTFLLAALILLVPILFVIWVNPGLLDRIQEELVQRPTPVGPQAAPISPPASDADSDDLDAPEPSPPSKDDYISAPSEADRPAALADTETDEDAVRTAAKPPAIVETEPDPDDSGVFEASPAAEAAASEPASDEASGARKVVAEQDGSEGEAAPERAAEPASAPAGDPVEPTEKSPPSSPLSTEPNTLAVPPLITPTPADVDGDGDGGGLRPLDEGPVTGLPTPATPPIEGTASEPEPASEDSATPDSAPATAGDDRHEEILREIRSLATAQRSLEDQFSALRQDIDGRLSVLKSAVDGVAINGPSGSGSASAEASAEEALAGSTANLGSAAEQARAGRAAKILRGTLDGELTLELGDESGATIDFVYVPPGRFRMGRTSAEAEAAVAKSVAAPAQEIVVGRGFFISKHEVTDEQFVAFLRANYSDDPKLDAVIEARDDLDRPAANVSWALAKYFCLWAAKQSEFDVRLPTEVEWEYAARGPHSLLRPDGLSNGAAAESGDAAAASTQSARDAGEDPTDRSWCGALDMLGNVAEWCADAYDANAYVTDDAGAAKVYSPAPAPADWNAVDAAGRSVRGGSFADPVATRDFSERRQAKPGVSSPTLGFRVVLIPDFDGEVEVGQAP